MSTWCALRDQEVVWCSEGQERWKDKCHTVTRSFAIDVCVCEVPKEVAGRWTQRGGRLTAL